MLALIYNKENSKVVN